MKTFILAAALSALCVPAAHAAKFEFTDQFQLGLDLHDYSWKNGPLVTGSFDANLTGVTFTDISNFVVFVDGVKITQPGRFDSTTLSSDGSNDHFYVSYDTESFTSHYAIGSYHDIQTKDINGYYGAFKVSAALDPGPSGVPEPASWAMLLVGFGAIGGAMRSSRKTAVTFG